jgi:signal transduction histidine kinase
MDAAPQAALQRAKYVWNGRSPTGCSARVPTPPTRTLQLRIALAFAGLIVGFLGAALYVPFALWPVAQRAESVQRYRADATRALSDLTDAARDIRAAAVMAYSSSRGAAPARKTYERDVAEARGRLSSLVRERLPVPGQLPELERLWRQLTERDVQVLVAAASAAVDASLRTGSDPTALQHLHAASASLDHTLRQITDLSAAAAQADAKRIHARIRWLAFGFGALAVIGTAGALVLLFQTLSLLRRYTRATEQRVSELDAFAGQVSHDLRSPLQNILLAAETIERRAQDGTIQRLAALARTGVGRLAAQDVHARVAAVALEAIVVNLVENAIKYRRSEEGARVDVLATAEAERVVLEVKDNGVGITPALLPRLFEPFVRGAKRSDSYGLGLATVRRLVDAHLGRIAVVSQEGSGSTFTVSFRRAEPPAKAQECALIRAPNAPT